MASSNPKIRRTVMQQDFQHRSQDERQSLAEQIEDLYRRRALERRQEWEESQRQPLLPESD
jgi:hypothetical protein